MAKDCVVNELSFRDLDDRAHDLSFLVARLAALPRLLGPDTVLWACHRHDDRATRAGAGFDRCIRAVRALPRGDDRQRRALFFLQRLRRFPANVEPDATHDVGCARGLARAHEIGGLALSLDVVPWRHASIEIEIAKIVGDGVKSTRGRVKHATREQHLREHLPWVELADSDRLRVLLALIRVFHTPASQYKKHVQGASNDERRESASKPAAPGQYFAEVDGKRVTDAMITSWENEALERVRAGHVDGARVEKRGASAYHVYCELGHPVGYASAGAVTNCVRVEWKDGQVHSHPRPTSDARQSAK